MKTNLLTIILSIFLVSFLNIGGCGGGSDSDDSMPEDMDMPMDMDDEVPDNDDGEEPEDPQQQPTFISGGQISQTPQTFSYVENGSDRQSLDYYAIQGLQTANIGTRPAILFVHGGGWLIGSKEDIDPFLFDVAEEAGFHVISIGYRLADDVSAPWPAIIQDVNTAIRWIKLNSEMLGVVPDSLIISGPSAGGHLASLVSVASDVPELQGTENPGADTTVKAAIAIFGVHNLNTLFSTEAVERFFNLGCDIERAIGAVGVVRELIDDSCPLDLNILNPLSGCDDQQMDLASPVVHVDSTDPPMFLIHGIDDCNVPFFQSEEMAEALDDAGVFNRFILTEGGMHTLESINLTSDDILNFLEEVFEFD